MDDDQYSNIANFDQDNASTNILDVEFKNATAILIAEFTGSIPRNYSTELQRLNAYSFYPPLNPKQLHSLAIDNVTSNEVKYQMAHKIYKQLELVFEKKIINWNSVVQTTAKRFVTNGVEHAVDVIQEKLLGNIDNEQQTPTYIIQRFVLIDNQLKVVSNFF